MGAPADHPAAAGRQRPVVGTPLFSLAQHPNWLKKGQQRGEAAQGWASRVLWRRRPRAPLSRRRLPIPIACRQLSSYPHGCPKLPA